MIYLYSYSRVSKVGERSDYLLSPDIQQDSHITYEKSHDDVTLIRPFIVDLDETGRKFERQKLHFILNGIAAGKAQGVLLWKWSRWGRDLLQSKIYIAKVEEVGGIVVAATEDFDVNTAVGKFSRDQMLLIAEFQSNMMGEGWKEVHANRRARGLPASGKRRFGYVRHKVRGEEEYYAVDEDLRDVVAWMYDQYITGKSNEYILDSLNRRGIMNAYGRPWIITTVQSYLDSGFAAGRLVRVPVVNGKRNMPPFPKLQWDQGAHHPIISAEVWEYYRAARLSRNGNNRNKSGVYGPIHPKHVFAGLLECGDCHGNMTRSTQTSSKRSTRTITVVCTKYISSRSVRCVSCQYNRIERAVKAWLAEFAAELEKRQASVELAEQKRLHVKSQLETAEARLRKLDRDISELTRQKVSGEVPQAAYDATIGGLVSERESAEESVRISRMEKVIPIRNPRDVSISLLEHWDLLPVDEARAMIASLIEKIIIHPPEQRGRPAGIEVVPSFVL